MPSPLLWDNKAVVRYTILDTFFILGFLLVLTLHTVDLNFGEICQYFCFRAMKARTFFFTASLDTL